MTTAIQHRLDDGDGSFTTPNERKREAAAKKRLAAAQAKAAKTLDAACDAMRELFYAYQDAHPDVPIRGDDGRTLLIASMAEYST